MQNKYSALTQAHTHTDRDKFRQWARHAFSVQPCANAMLKFLISCQGLRQTRTTCGRKVRWPQNGFRLLPAMEHPIAHGICEQNKLTECRLQESPREADRERERELGKRAHDSGRVRERERASCGGVGLGARCNYVGVARHRPSVLFTHNWIFLFLFFLGVAAPPFRR